MDPITQVSNLFKAGYKTTEFWLVLVAGVWNAIVQVWQPGHSWQSQAPALIFAGVTAVYALARTWIKTARVSAIAVITGAVNGAAGAAGAGDAGTGPTGSTGATAGAGRVVNPRTRKTAEK